MAPPVPTRRPHKTHRLSLLFGSSPGRPDVRGGIRAAAATMVPLLAAQLLETGGASWMSLAGFSVAIADRGGAYRARAETMLALTLAGAVSATVGGLGGRDAWIAVPLTLVWVLLSNAGRLFGNAGISVASSTAVTFVIALAAPSPDLGEALSRAGYFAIGGLWAALLSLVLWPLRPFRPLRAAVAECYELLASYASDLSRDISAARPGPGLVVDEHDRVAIRTALEEARERIGAGRRGRAGESGRAEHLLVLVQGADQLLGTTVALHDLLEEFAPELEASARLLPIAERLDAFARAARRVAEIVGTEGEPPTAMTEDLASLLGHAPVQRRGDSSAARATRAAAAAAQISRVFSRIEEYAAVAITTALAIDSGAPPSGASAALAVGTEDRLSVAEILRAGVGTDSLVFRHGLRVGIVTAVAVAATHLLGLTRGYWVTLTVLIILQPYTGATLVKALQRVLGTVAGGVLTAGLVALVHDPRGLLAIIFVFAIVCVAFLRVNYLVYSIFLTPTFVLLAELSEGDWHLAGIRVLNTVLGGALGLLGALLIWPAPERSRFSELAATMLRACRDHLRAVGDNWSRSDRASAIVMAQARRATSLATMNAEASFERVLAESTRPARALEPQITLLTYTRRLVGTTTSLAVSRLSPHAESMRALVQAEIGRAAEHLDALAVALLGEGSRDRTYAAGSAEAGPAAPAPESAADPVVAMQLERIRRQIEVLQAAVNRIRSGTSWSAAVSNPPRTIHT